MNNECDRDPLGFQPHLPGTRGSLSIKRMNNECDRKSYPLSTSFDGRDLEITLTELRDAIIIDQNWMRISSKEKPSSTAG